VSLANIREYIDITDNIIKELTRIVNKRLQEASPIWVKEPQA
jgi:hypothetical protein